jgi:hypothetical protein
MLLSLCNVCDFITLVTPRNIERQEGREKILQANSFSPLTHYMICESDRLRLKEGSFVKNDGRIAFVLLQQRTEFDWESHEVEIPSNINGVEFDISLVGPIVKMTSQSGAIEWFDNTFLFLEILASVIGASETLSEVLRLTVKYVGQTEISNDYIRFDGHEKLNSISNDIIAVRPHREVWVKMLSFQRPFFTMMSIPEIDSPYREDWLPGGGLLENLPHDEWKTIVEGALIKYFQPELNKHYKRNFPSDRHTSYKYFYDRDFRSVVVELHEEFRSYVTGNETAPYTKIKMIEFALSSDDKGTFLHDNSKQDLDDIIIRGKV